MGWSQFLRNIPCRMWGKYQIQHHKGQIQHANTKYNNQKGADLVGGGLEGGAGVNLLTSHWSNPLTYCHLPPLPLVQLH